MAKTQAARLYSLAGYTMALIVGCGIVILTPLIANAGTSMLFNFNQAGTLIEAGSLGGSTSPYFWLNSGAKLVINNGVAGTVHGSLNSSDPWRLAYASANARDTDNGYHPQNIFRLVTKNNTWRNVVQEFDFKIDKLVMSASPERDAWSGILSFARYKDGNNLYYIGIRDDGKAVVKRKKNGSYTTLAEAQVFSGTYNRSSNPSLIPQNTWMGLKTEVKDVAGGVQITAWLDRNNDGSWQKIVSVTDSSNAITGNGSGGIRTDYKDVSFDNYKLTEL